MDMQGSTMAAIWLSQAAAAAVFVYVFSGYKILSANPKGRPNRVAAALCATLALWALQAVLSYSTPYPELTVNLAKLLSWTWTFFPVLGYHLSLELRDPPSRVPAQVPTGIRRVRPGWLILAAGYLGAAYLYYLLAGPLLMGAERRAGYWSVGIRPGLGFSAFSAFYLCFNLLGIATVAARLIKSRNRRERRRLAIVAITHAVSILGGFTTDTILGILGIDFPRVGVLWAGVWAVGLNVAMAKYGFLSPFSAKEIGLLMDRFIERSMDGIVVCDGSGRVIYWNAPLAEHTGIGAEEAMASTIDELYGRLAVRPGYRPLSKELIRSIAAAGEAGGRRLAELEIKRPDGGQRWLQASAFLIPGEAGDILASIVRDVSKERLAAEEALDRLRRQSHAQKMEALGALAAGIAHDFNNTLGGIVGAAAVIRACLGEASRLPPEVARGVEIIEGSAQRAASSVRGLMAFAKDIPQRSGAFRLGDAASRVTELARRSMGPNVCIDTEGLDAEAWVRGDALQIEQLLLNLLINAEHALTIMRCPDEAKGGTIRVSLRREGGTWALTVSDDGVGMDEATAAKVFDPFFTTKGPEQGSGLGLSMAQLIANQHGGALTIKTAPGQGAAFTVHLPEGFDRDGLEWQDKRLVPDLSALAAKAGGRIE
jgi:PAS domain S-box-containing protein